METYCAVDGDTWDSVAQANRLPTSWLMLHNGLDPNASPAPDDPEAGAILHIPDDPPGCAIAPENSNLLDLGAGGLETVRIRLHDDACAPMANVRYAVQCTGPTTQGVSEDGWVTVVYPAGACVSAELQWGAPDEDSDHPYQLSVILDCFAGTDEDQAVARLGNLGYDASVHLDAAVRQFQTDYAIDENGLSDEGTLPAATTAALSAIFDGDCDATLPEL